MLDLAQAHLLALQSDFVGALNLGTGGGSSVRQVIDTVKKVAGHDFPVEVAPRRPGDPARLIADSTAARKILGWNPQYQDLETIVRSAWDWKQAHPLGYNDR